MHEHTPLPELAIPGDALRVIDKQNDFLPGGAGFAAVVPAAGVRAVDVAAGDGKRALEEMRAAERPGDPGQRPVIPEKGPGGGARP